MSKCTTTTDIEQQQKKVKALKDKKAELINKLRYSSNVDQAIELRRKYDIIDIRLESEENILNKVWKNPKYKTAEIGSLK